MEVTGPELTSCTVELVRLWGPDETDHHAATVEASAASDGDAIVLEWPLFPDDWTPGNLHDSVAEKRRRDVPPTTFALFACQNAEERPVRFVGAPVVVETATDE